MKPKIPMHTSIQTLFRRAPILAAAASLLLAPSLFAQTPAPAAKEPSLQASPERRPTGPVKEFYNLKFDGGDTWGLNYTLREQLSAENVVVIGSVRRLPMPAFELHNVRLAEIARTIEFLGEGQLRVEVTENAASGNVWLIGRKNPAEAAATVKMRSVAAPNLIANEKMLGEITEAAKTMQMARAGMTDLSGAARAVIRDAVMEPLKSQKIFVIIGDEEGVAGLESLIKAAEQRLADAAAAKVAAFAANAPKICAVLAPHVFADAERAKKLTGSLDGMRHQLMELRMDIEKELGMDIIMRAPWAEARPRPEQKVFVLSGTEAGIAGMESLIKAAEQIAAEEDAKIAAEMEQVRAEKVAAFKAEQAAVKKAYDDAVLRKAEDEGALKKAEDRAKEGKSEQ